MHEFELYDTDGNRIETVASCYGADEADAKIYAEKVLGIDPSTIGKMVEKGLNPAFGKIGI